MPATDQHCYNLNRLHRLFAASSLLLLAATLVVFDFDHSREWRRHQRVLRHLQSERLRDQIRQVKEKLAGSEQSYDKQLADLRRQLAETQQRADEAASQAAELQRRKHELEERRQLLEMELKTAKSELVAARSAVDLAINRRRPKSVLDKLKKAARKKEQRVAELENRLDQLERQLDDLASRRAATRAARRSALKKLKELANQIERLQRELARLEPTSWTARLKQRLVSLPILDAFNSPYQVANDWLPGLKIQLGMATTDRFDRCRTCHAAIDSTDPDGRPTFPLSHDCGSTPAEWVASGQFPNPYAAHPRLDLFVSERSPHPRSKFGCTVCHEGQGSATSFTLAAHTPDDPVAAKRWEQQRGWRRASHWNYPMLPRRLVESSCLKCHHDVVDLQLGRDRSPAAPKLLEGWRLVRDYGCYGCHPIPGSLNGKAIGPDLRLQPNYAEVAAQLLFLWRRAKTASEQNAGDSSKTFSQVSQLLEQIVRSPDDSAAARAAARQELLNQRQQLLEALVPSNGSHDPPPATRAEVDRLLEALADQQNPGQLDKIGPSLRHIASKLSRDWVLNWLNSPSQLLSNARMPRFFGLSNQTDPQGQRYVPVEMAAVVEYLFYASQPAELLDWRDEAARAQAPEFKPDPARGKLAFAQRGCLACHRHADYPKAGSDFGPDLSRLFDKLLPGQAGFRWLYTWLREPRTLAPQTRMPHTFVGPRGTGSDYTDDAADIAAYLLQGRSQNAASAARRPFAEQALDELVLLFATKTLGRLKAQRLLAGRTDQVDLPPDSDEARFLSGPLTRSSKLLYVGRKTIARYGCFGCHDIPGFETAAPVGVALHDWGRKNTELLAFNHIDRFLEVHGEPDGSSTRQRLQKGLARLSAGQLTQQDKQDLLSAAFFYDSLLNHERAGFLWQKLRDPRSYDYLRTDLKSYDERLVMPQYDFNQRQLEAIATFILGLVAEPPSEPFRFVPDKQTRDLIDGQRAWERYNCGGCHMLDLPEITYGVDLEEVFAPGPGPDDFPEAVDMLLQFEPPRDGLTGETRTFDVFGERRELPLATFRGLLYFFDPEEEPEFRQYAYDLWETLRLGDQVFLPGSRLMVPASRLVEQRPANGGRFAEWLVDWLIGREGLAYQNRYMAWQMAPPPLYLEGRKVQTAWLFQFLKSPGQLRHTTTGRMPRFSLSDAEARSLANFFAARDRAEYPFQEIPERSEVYLAQQQARFRRDHPERDTDYLTECWLTLNGPLCIKCHSLGGRTYQTVDPTTDIRGPDLEGVDNRLQSDWLTLWLFNPRWLLPYTSMPQSFPRTQKQLEPLFGGDPLQQTIGVRDAVLNYSLLMERLGKVEPKPTTAGGR